jgi:hypothetical protein
MARTSDNTDIQPRKRTRNQSKASSSNPPPPHQPPIQTPPTQPTTYQRFKTEKAEERYQEIKEREFVGERAFDVTKLTEHPTFEETLREKGWEGLNGMVTKTSNKSIALEFFANAYAEEENRNFAIVRGKKVVYDAGIINAVLGLPAPANCDVVRRTAAANWPTTHEEWDNLLVGIMKEGQGWRRKTPTSNPQRINTAHLLPIFRAWASFINSTIEGTSAAAQMILNRVFILLVLLSDHEQMDVGRLISRSIKEMVRTKSSTLGHSCLINLLCEKAGVPTEPLDVFVKSQNPITDITLEGYEKKMREEGGVQHELGEQPEVQGAPEAEYPPMHPALAEYIYTSANWQEEASSQLLIEPPRFSEQFAAMALQYKRKPTGSYKRFGGSKDRMESYFEATRQRAVQLEKDIREDFEFGENVEIANMLSTDPPDLSGDDQQDHQQDQMDEEEG